MPEERNQAAVIRHRPPGVVTPPWAWVGFLLGWIGMGVDGWLAIPVINRGFKLSPVLSTVVIVILGLIAAEVATTAATTWHTGKRAVAMVTFCLPLVIGLALAGARSFYSAPPTAPARNFESAATAGPATHPAWPATVLMLAIFVAAMAGIFLSALKVFHPARKELKRHKKTMERINIRRIPLEKNLVAIRQRIGTRESREGELTRSREHVLSQVAARRAALKAYARDAIARAVSDPAATPLVRAPQVPPRTGGDVPQHPGGDQAVAPLTHDTLHAVQ